jgi:hypothetical protein
MSALRALSMMGSLAGGFMKGQDDIKREEREAKDAEQAQQLKQLQINDFKRKQDDEDALRGAAAPTVVEDASAGPMPEGQVARARGQGFASMADAQAGAAAMDANGGGLARRQQVLQTIDPMRAVQEKLAATQAASTEQDLADKLAGRTLAKSLITEGWDGFAKHLSDSPIDGQGGGVKFGVVKSPEGKGVRIAILDDKGQPTQRGMDFTDDEEGRMKALNTAMTLTSPQARLDHYKWESDKRQKQDNWQAEFGLKKDEAKSMADYRAKMGDAAGAKAEKYGGSAVEKMNDADKVLHGTLTRKADHLRSLSEKLDPSDPTQAAQLKKYQEDIAVVEDQADGVLRQYRDAGASPDASADPLGIRSGGASQPTKSGGGKQSKFASTQAEMDRGQILSAELAKAIQLRDSAPAGSPEWTRAQADVQSVQSELKATGTKAKGTSSGDRTKSARPSVPAPQAQADTAESRNNLMRTVSASPRTERKPVNLRKSYPSMAGQKGLTPEEIAALSKFTR